MLAEEIGFDRYSTNNNLGPKQPSRNAGNQTCLNETLRPKDGYTVKKRRENKGTVPGYKRKVEENQERSENRQTDTKAGIWTEYLPNESKTQ